MNFDFSEDAKTLRETARAFLASSTGSESRRAVLDEAEPYDAALWRQILELGWLGVAVDEANGGVDLGYEGLCVLAEELGASLAPAPALSSLAVIAILLQSGSHAQKQRWIPPLLDGRAIGALAFAESAGDPSPTHVRADVRDGKLHGQKLCVAYGGSANLIIVAARCGGSVGFFLCEDAVSSAPLKTLDLLRPHAVLTFDGVCTEPLPGAQCWAQVQRLLDRIAIVTAFEQLGGASACLDMAVAYAKERHAFGRAIGSFQAIKHTLADCYVALELARANAYYGAFALTHDREEMEAAACARISAAQAYHRAAHACLHVFGGAGFMWDAPCHLHVRRARMLSSAYGSPQYWKRRLISEEAILGL